MLDPHPNITRNDHEHATGPTFETPVSHLRTRSVAARNAFFIAGGLLALFFGLCAVIVVAGILFIRGVEPTMTTRSRTFPVSERREVAMQTTPQQVVVVATPEGGVDYETAVLINIYEQVNPSVVSIIVLSTAADAQNLFPFGQPPDPDDLLPFSNGSGFVWDADGHIVTNNHVVEGAREVQVTFSDGTMSMAEVVGTDPDSDIAVVKIDPEGYALVPVQRGSQDSLRVGMRVAAIGNPFGLEGTLTSGIVSALGRSIPGAGQFSIADVIQTDAAINPGNSGGPLLNESGEVIGVNAQIRSEVRANSGVGFAIPIRIVERVVPALIDNGSYEHSYIGVEGRTYSPICSEDLELAKELRGALVLNVLPRTPAARAGLRGGAQQADTRFAGICPEVKGGDLIMAIDEQLVTSFDDVLVYLQRNTSPGDTVMLSVLRDGEEQQVEVTLGARPSR